MKIVLISIAVVIVATLLYSSVRVYILFRRTVALEASIVPFTRSVPNASMRILVLGDSTAVGTGASSPADSTAGRLATLYPNADVVNLAVNGLRISGLLKILSTMDMHQHFDIVLIQIGANDIIRLTPMSAIQSGIEQVLAETQSFGGKVILLHSGNIGDSTFFPWYVRPWLSSRSYAVRDIYEKEAPAYGAQYVDLIDSSISSTMRKDPSLYYADDHLHLSSAGYGLWFDEIQKQL